MKVFGIVKKKLKLSGKNSSDALKRIVAQVYSFNNTQTFKNWLELALHKNQLSQGDLSIGARLLKAVHVKIINAIANKIRESDGEACASFCVTSLDAVRLGKICFIGESIFAKAAFHHLEEYQKKLKLHIKCLL